jgi:hypothetical protein
MIHKLLSLAGAAVLALTSTAYAKEPLPLNPKQPVTLSDRQMDRVTAGGSSIANAAGISFGEVHATSLSQTSTDLVAGVSGTNNPQRVALGQAWNFSIAAGGFLWNAQATSHADTFASLP